jgi:hypothetical protein
MNQRADFVPFFPSGRDAPVLLNKDAIRLVTLRAADLEVDPFAESRVLDLLLDDGSELRGSIHISAPLGHTRTLDSLNEAGRFLVLRADDCVHLVNLASVVLAADAF